MPSAIFRLAESFSYQMLSDHIEVDLAVILSRNLQQLGQACSDHPRFFI